MFFPRLRRQAKWVFVFLAFVFAAGFVFLGVGSGSTGIGDLLRGNFSLFGGSSTSGGPSISKARDRIKHNSKNAAAWRDLATAYQQKGQTDSAIAALRQFSRLRPKDVAALGELAGMELQRADELLGVAQQAQVDAATNSPAPLFAPSTSQNPLSQALTQDPVSQGLTKQANDAAQRVTTEYQAAEGDYLRLTKLSPTDSNAELQLAVVAQQVGDVPTATSAYKRFLKLAPDDPSAPLAKQRLKQLQGSLSAQVPPSAARP